MFQKVILILVVLISQSSMACGPWYPSSFLEGDRAFGNSDEIHRYELLGRSFFPEVGKQKYESVSISTVTADVLDFKDFLIDKKLSPVEQERVLEKYRQFGKDCRNMKLVSWDVELEGIEEFILYLTGVRELKLNGESYPKSWLKLLALPAEKRQYRTIWVYYMTANFTKSDEDRVYCYQKVRDLHTAGFNDRLGLASASFLSAFKYVNDVILKTEACVKAVYFYGVMDDQFVLEKIETLYSDFIDKLTAPQLRTLTANALGREVLLSIVSKYTRSSKSHFDYVLSILESVKDMPIKSAGLAAWVAYTDGHYKLAERFLPMASEQDLLALWIGSRLALRDGKKQEATRLLKKWLAIYKASKGSEAIESDVKGFSFHFGSWTPVDLPFLVHGELGLISISNRDFLQAMHTFMEGGAKHDACMVAEQCLSIEALQKYVDQYQQPALRDVLSRRLFRMGRYKLAYKYSEEKDKNEILKFGSLLMVAENQKFTRNKKALAFYNAAKILRHRGMELSGTLFFPDYTVVNGQRAHAIIGKDWQKKFGLDLKNSDWLYSDKRFHYRYKAADLMWKAVKLADSAALKAMAAYCGGRYIHNRDKQMADKYYKALVNSNCGQLSAAANVTRWFPITVEDYNRRPVIEIPKALEAEFKSFKPASIDDLDKLLNTLEFKLEYFEYYQKNRRKN